MVYGYGLSLKFRDNVKNNFQEHDLIINFKNNVQI
jgi:hypothetical protein